MKSDGWQWQRTRLTNPERAERQWLAMAVALLWTITLGGELEAESEGELSTCAKLIVYCEKSLRE